MIKALKIHPKDNVVTVIEPVQPGDTVRYAESGQIRGVPATEDVTIYHKIAILDIPMGAPVMKYGEIIGIATAPIPAGALVHVHNVTSAPHKSEFLPKDLK